MLCDKALILCHVVCAILRLSKEISTCLDERSKAHGKRQDFKMCVKAIFLDEK